MIQERLSTFAGLPVHTFDGEPDGPPPAPGDVAWGVYHHVADNGVWGAEVPENLDLFLETVDTAKVTHLVIGFWGFDPEEFSPVDWLVGNAGRLPNLRAVFLGDILDWDLHISWIKNGDISPLFEAYPGLEHFEIRGASDLRLEPIRSERLKVLRIESGGLPAEVVRTVMAGDLPALEHLDLWIGSEWYAGSSEADDYAPVLTGERFPSLRHLGLENGPFQDELAGALASAPVVPRLESLSLAMGMLSDRGAEALLAGQPLTHLRKLDLHHAFLSEPMVERLKAALPGVELDLRDAVGNAEWVGDEWASSALYVAVSE
ncbi:STM4015 family protein [Actinomadura madurae]|uniref:STM4015 family protein n=1 Tax=Actinomadura madurae TaxID=1993 RepID=UPI0020273202|nr:STM4015 family protein [Actinomadura madurae]MCP9966172.1 STM4015 family protein [Actinomadura madurae]MCQ0009817.1 STM4015 family protein [Actinomadura madurae]MCQ0014859.1 STM4015 family protein [Actinomadura madurae]URM94962.1 STM4015 family protein [Actinomadura madurae]URN05682.1 STM4015 family protein [Actinomadura madurae]